VSKFTQRTKKITKVLVDYVLLNRAGLFAIWLISKAVFYFYGPRDLKLNLGCGSVCKEGFVNIDHRFSRAVDIFLDIKRLPFPPGSASRIECYHVIEHIPQPQIADALDNWHAVLAEGGKLVIECPDVDGAMREYLEGNENRIYNVYGMDRFKGDIHYFGYNPRRLTRLLKDHGFDDCRQEEPTDYHKESEPCMRIVCGKRQKEN
jgi:SAM-dependent methyltransferase